MKRLRSATLLASVLLALPLTAHAQDVPESGCQFELGFAALHALAPGDVGTCVDDQSYAANGDATQRTSNGLLVWRKADNLTAFTNGSKTWLTGPFGLVSRSNTQRYPWEADYGATGTTELPPPLSANGQNWTIFFDKNLVLPAVQVDDGTGHLTAMPAKGQWVDIYFWARNNQTHPASLTADDVSLVDKQGHKYTTPFDLRQVTGPGTEAPLTNPVPPNQSVLLRATMDVGKDAVGGVLHTSGGNDVAAL